MIGLGSGNDILYKLFLFLVCFQTFEELKTVSAQSIMCWMEICGEMIFQSWQLCDCFERRMSTTSPELIVCRSRRLGRWLTVLEPPRYTGSKDKSAWIFGQCHFNYTKGGIRKICGKRWKFSTRAGQLGEQWAGFCNSLNFETKKRRKKYLKYPQMHINFGSFCLSFWVPLFGGGGALFLVSLLSSMHLLKCAPNHFSFVFRFTVTRGPNWPFRCLDCNIWPIS